MRVSYRPGEAELHLHRGVPLTRQVKWIEDVQVAAPAKG